VVSVVQEEEEIAVEEIVAEVVVVDVAEDAAEETVKRVHGHL